MPRHDKYLLWAHDILHNDWGGTTPSVNAKTAAITSLYVPAFLRWQMLEVGDPTDRQHYTDLLHHARDEVMLDPSLDGTGFWNACTPEFTDLDSPVIFGAFSPGLQGDPSVRLQIDNMKRLSSDACLSAISPASSGKTVTTSGFALGQVCMGSAESLTKPLPMGSDDSWHRETSAMRVRWGDMESGGSVRWEVDEDLSDYSFLSFRVGQINHASPHTMTTVEVGLTTPSGMTSQTFSTNIEIYAQDDVSGALTSQTVNFIRTVRVPLEVFCDLGADIGEVEEVVITFPNDLDSRTVLVDSIEFTKAEDAMDAGQCL